MPPSPGGAGSPPASGSRRPAEPLALGDSTTGTALGSRERGRVTIDFTGPPLELPSFDTVAAESADPRGPTERPPAAVARSASPRDAEEHDAWVTDRKRRSTLPPIEGVSFAPPAAATGAPALRHKWVSKQQAELKRASRPPSAMGLPASGGDALTLADRGRPSEPSLDLMAEVRARYALDDLTGALKMAELVLGSDADNVEAARFATICRERLESLYTSQLGPLSSVPRVDVPETDIRWLGLDHRAGFLLSRIDGLTTVDELLDLSGMPRLEALKTMLGLLDAGAIVIPR